MNIINQLKKENAKFRHKVSGPKSGNVRTLEDLQLKLATSEKLNDELKGEVLSLKRI